MKRGHLVLLGILVVIILFIAGCAGMQLPPCTEESTRCSSNNILTCVNGSWKTTQKCSDLAQICEVLDGNAECTGQNYPPVVDAGENGIGEVGKRITVYANANDEDGDELSIEWEIISAPTRNFDTGNENSLNPWFIPTEEGVYKFRLKVSDGIVTSEDWVGFGIGGVTCVDSDGGLNYYVEGRAEGYDGSFSSDICDREGVTLTEGYCDKGGVRYKIYSCPNDCKNNACVLVGVCADSDNGEDYNTKGVAFSSKNGLDEDKCQDNIWLQEAICNINDDAAHRLYQCPNGCSDGVCLNETSPIQTYEPCTESDNGNIAGLKGTVTVKYNYGTPREEIISVNDSCSSETDLIEYFCESEIEGDSPEIYVCLDGCKDGACINETCRDTDGGRNLYEKGILSSIDNLGSQYKKEDGCVNSTTLSEYYCDIGPDGGEIVEYNCPAGCVDGACIKVFVDECKMGQILGNISCNDYLVKSDGSVSLTFQNNVGITLNELRTTLRYPYFKGDPLFGNCNPNTSWEAGSTMVCTWSVGSVPALPAGNQFEGWIDLGFEKEGKKSGIGGKITTTYK